MLDTFILSTESFFLIKMVPNIKCINKMVLNFYHACVVFITFQLILHPSVKFCHIFSFSFVPHPINFFNPLFITFFKTRVRSNCDKIWKIEGVYVSQYREQFGWELSKNDKLSVENTKHISCSVVWCRIISSQFLILKIILP